MGVHVRVVFVELVQQLVISVLQCGRLAGGAAHIHWVYLCDNTLGPWPARQHMGGLSKNAQRNSN